MNDDLSGNLKTVEIGDGLRMEYACRGTSGRTLLMLHGYVDSWYSYNGVMNALPCESTRAFSPSQRGHGMTTCPSSGYAMGTYAEDAFSFMDALDIPDAIVVGHSMGSFIAQEMALTRPERVAGLVLIGSAVWSDNELLRDFHDEVLGLVDPVSHGFVREFQAGTCARPCGPGIEFERIVSESMKVKARVWGQALGGLRAYRPPQGEPDLSGITCPTLILWGDGDEIFPREQQDRLQSLIPNAEVAVRTGAGHGLHWEEPVETARAIQRFADSR